MYEAPSAFRRLIAVLAGYTTSKQQATRMAQVELTLTLARCLGLDSEPITIGWVLLSRMPLQHPVLERLTDEQRRMRANAAIIVPFSSRFAWEHALAQYATEAPREQRLYAIQKLRLDEQMIATCRQQPCPDPMREQRYEDILKGRLPFAKRDVRSVKANETYRVRVSQRQSDGGAVRPGFFEGNRRSGTVRITEDLQRPANEGIPWFAGPRPRTVIRVMLEDLKPTADFLDEREQCLGGQAHWARDLSAIRFRRTLPADDSGRYALDPDENPVLELKGAVHLPAMVSAGKTTLAKLIIAHSIKLDWDVRITFVVGDSHTAIETAHQVNRWFYDDPAGDDVVAVPILGVTQREVHLRRLLESREYANLLRAGKPHWGERWLMPVCPLAASITWEGDANVTIQAGREPCEYLMSLPKSEDRKLKGKPHLCPLFHHCPSKQVFRDMPRAKLWVITPGALSQASLPLHLDRRIVRMGDLVYEQSDLVIFDEVETIVDWFDRTFAQSVELTGSGTGLLDKLDIQLSRHWSENRVQWPDADRWITSQRESVHASSSILTAIANLTLKRTVSKWVGNHHFTPNQLAYRLARRLAGLKEWDGPKVLDDERRENAERAQAAFAPFDVLLNKVSDPLRWQAPPDATPVEQAASGLAHLMQILGSFTANGAHEEFLALVRQWLMSHYPHLEKRLTELGERLRGSGEQYDAEYVEEQLDLSVDDLMHRLHFLLIVALLDRHMHIVIEEWHNKPETLEGEQPFSRIPRSVRDILPLPLTGQQYGFVVQQGKARPGNEGRHILSLFAYTNIGRSYLLNFDHLRQDLEGTPGPHILALSGTSYLPASTPFHVTLPPNGVLLTPQRTEDAVRDSRFVWRWFPDRQGRPIYISGQQNKEQQFRRLMLAMTGDGGMPGGFFAKTLAWLEAQAAENPEQWGDRARLLLLTNSYPQARIAAQALRERWPTMASKIFDLRRGRPDENEDYEIQTDDAEHPGHLRRMDIERFAEMDGQILVAPMLSIGRGFNILNRDGRAAFGALFFLTRFMNPPHDMAAAAQELNRYSLAWAEDRAFVAWQDDTLYRRALNARDRAMELRRAIERRIGYRKLNDNADLKMYPRHDLAATTAGRIVQAVGRLVRGGVPFRAYFVDAAWSPQAAESGDASYKEPAKTSLLTGVIDILSDYIFRDDVARQLYGGLCEALITTEGRDSN
ncbi:MAG: hypothetical protein IT323_01890 [Anaerolineae bacterium]|nr:hypothetical protein [Anaerolineae bacterium]